MTLVEFMRVFDDAMMDNHVPGQVMLTTRSGITKAFANGAKAHTFNVSGVAFTVTNDDGAYELYIHMTSGLHRVDMSPDRA